jgi:hypothetical protein
METKLRANADHFSTSELRKTYVASRLAGAAYDQIVPVLNDSSGDSEITLDDGDDILDFLEQIYGDPVRQDRAEFDFEKLRMKDSDKFAVFLAEFTRLANDAMIPREKRVKLLHRKLTPKLQHKLVGKASKSGITLTEFVEKAHRVASTLEIMDADVQQTKATKATAAAANANKAPNIRTLKPVGTDSPVPVATAAAYPKLDAAEILKRKKEGRCYECNEKGHRGGDCPQRTARLAAEAAAAAAKKTPTVAELAPSELDATPEVEKD